MQNPKYITLFINSSPLDPFLRQINPVHILLLYFLKIHINIVSNAWFSQ